MAKDLHQELDGSGTIGSIHQNMVAECLSERVGTGVYIQTAFVIDNSLQESFNASDGHRSALTLYPIALALKQVVIEIYRTGIAKVKIGSIADSIIQISFTDLLCLLLSDNDLVPIGCAIFGQDVSNLQFQ